MTDLEITKLCAEAMGCTPSPLAGSWDSVPLHYFFGGRPFTEGYDPLHDDAQAMALVKKFHLGLYPYQTVHEKWWWKVGVQTNAQAMGEELNRAICECVAKMQQAKAGETK